MSHDLLPDAVWSQLDPRAARLDPRSRRNLVLLLISAAVLALVVVLAQLSGLLLPKLSWDWKGGQANWATHVVQLDADVTNDGWVGTRIDAIDVTTTGFEFVRSKGAAVTIAPGQDTHMSVVMHVTDCRLITRTATVSVQLRVHRWWGEKSVTLDYSGELPWLACHRSG